MWIILFQLLMNNVQANQIEAYGDSLTAGLLSDTQVVEAPPLPVVSRILSDLLMFQVTQDRRYLDPHERRDLAWPSQLARILPAPFGGWVVNNLARSGARSHHLLAQVQEARSQGQTIALFFIGHNDLCNNFEEAGIIGDRYESEVAKALAHWDSGHRHSIGLLIPIGDIHHVYELLAGFIWHEEADGTYRCEDNWQKFFPYCRSHYELYARGTLSAHLGPRIDAMNERLAKLGSHWNHHSRAENRYIYLRNVHHLPLEKAYFATDCYHLSATGQYAFATTIARALLRDW